MKGFPQTALERADHLAVVCGADRLTYAALDARASALARDLRSLAEVDGGRVGIMLPNSADFVVALAATAKLGAAALAVNWHLRAEELAWIVDDSGVAALVAHVDLRDVVEAVTATRAVPVRWIGGDDPVGTDPDPLPYLWPTSWPVIYTSGTSGRPKGVVHGGMAAPEIMEMAQDGLAALWGYGPDDVHLVAGPLYHAGPCGYAGSTLYQGGTVVVMPSWDPREFLRLVEEERATTTFLTPAHFIRLLEVPADERARYDLSSLRHVLHAGAPCPRPVKAAIIDALPGAEVWELYGASEGGATRASPAEWLERPGTVGRPWPGVEVRIVDPTTGAEQPAGADGLVYVKPAVGRFRYHNDPEKTASTWREEDFTVGDIGHLDDDGYLFLTDRASDLIIRAGVNLYPREVEDVLFQHPDVVDCAVFGVPHDRDGEHPTAVVEVRAGSLVSAEDLDLWCRERLDPYKCPTTIALVDELPRDPNGKVLKRILRDRAWADAGRQI